MSKSRLYSSKGFYKLVIEGSSMMRVLNPLLCSNLPRPGTALLFGPFSSNHQLFRSQPPRGTSGLTHIHPLSEGCFSIFKRGAFLSSEETLIGRSGSACSAPTSAANAQILPGNFHLGI